MPGLALTVGELVGYLRVDSSGWRRGMGQAHREFDGFSRDVNGRLRDLQGRFVAEGEAAGRGFATGLTRETGTLSATTDRVAGGFVRIALAMSNVVTAGAAIHGVSSTVTALGAALTLLPAAGVAVGVGMIAARVGVAGFGEALKNAGDPEAFAESLERLSPDARETAVAVRDLGPAWRSVQQTTQEALFAGVADDVLALGGRYLPVLKSGLSGVAGEFNRAARDTASFLGEARQVETVSGIFGEVRASAGEMSTAVTPLVSILLDLVAVGSEFLPGMAGGFADAAQRAAEFVSEARETGELHEWISSGLATLRQLGELLANLGGIAGAVFRGLGLGGEGLLGTLVQLTDEVEAFLETVQGQEALAAFGEVLATVSGVVSEVFLAALQQLAPVVLALAPGFAQLATQVGSVLVAALTVVGPLLVQLATFLSQNAAWLGPLAIGLYGAVKAFQAVTAAVRLLTIVSSVNPWVAIVTATLALATLIVTNWETITQAVGTAWRWLSDRAAEIWGWIDDHIVRHVENAVGAVRTGVGHILDFFGWLASLPGKVAAWFASVRDGAIRKLGELVEWVKGLPGKIVRALGNVGRLLWDAGVNIIKGLLDGLKSMAQRVITFFIDLIGDAIESVLNVLGISSPSRVFRQIGVWSGQGLIDGLRSMMDPVAGASGALASAAVPTLPASTAPSMGGAAGGGAFGDNARGNVGAATGGRSALHIEHYHAPPDADPAEQAQAWDWLSRGGG